MKIFECEKCKSREVFISENGNNVGLYCADCGKWIKWLNKDELRLAERQIEGHDREIRNKAIDEFANKCKEKVMQTQISRLEWFEIDEIARELKAAKGSD